MTDQEITRLIAEKLMGWNNAPTTEYVSMDVHTGGEFTTKLQLFNPLTNDSHCMAAWDKFSEGRVLSIVRYSDGEWGATSGTTPNEWSGQVNPDRRRAMCETMAKAVS